MITIPINPTIKYVMGNGLVFGFLILRVGYKSSFFGEVVDDRAYVGFGLSGGRCGTVLPRVIGVCFWGCT